jgi:hypothetical protein
LSNRLCEIVVNERHIMTTNDQLELGFNGTQTRIFGRRRENRLARGQWWFAKMRATVASAMDWSQENPPRPEQIIFAGTQREVKI